MGSDFHDVLSKAGQLVSDDPERLPRCVLASGLSHQLLERALGVEGDSASSVRDHEDSLNAEQVNSQDQGLEGGRGDTTTRIAKDLGVTGLETQHLQRHDP